MVVFRISGRVQTKVGGKRRCGALLGKGTGIRQGSAQPAVSGGTRVVIEVGGEWLSAQAPLSIKALGWALGGAARASALGEGVDDG
jgi:hypothetical protein